MSRAQRAFADWYADRAPDTPNTWWNNDHECDVTCDCGIEAIATAMANDSIVIDESDNVA